MVENTATAPVRVLLVSEPGEAREAYERELASLGAVFDAADTPQAAYGLLGEERYNGLLLDLPTWIRAGTREKSQLQRILERLPVLRLLYHPEQGGIRGVSLGATVREAKDLRDFLDGECRAFAPRLLRLSERRGQVCHLTVLFEGESRRAVTANVSLTGCFIVAFDEYRKGQELLLAFRDIPDGPPVPAEVRWVQPWGEGRRMPGIGVRFLSLTEKQRDGLLPEAQEKA